MTLYGIISSNGSCLISNDNFEVNSPIVGTIEINLNPPIEPVILRSTDISLNYVEIPEDIFISIFGKNVVQNSYPGEVFSINF